jgi:hypothetical protein
MYHTRTNVWFKEHIEESEQQVTGKQTKGKKQGAHQ